MTSDGHHLSTRIPLFPAKQSSRACASDEKIFRRKVVGKREAEAEDRGRPMANSAQRIVAAFFSSSL